MKFSPKLLLHGIAVIVLCVFIVWNSKENMGKDAVSANSDANQYMRMAHHIYHHHTVSISKDTPPPPDCHREPGFSTYLALMMNFSPKLAQVGLETISLPEGGLVMFRALQIPSLVAASLCVWVLTTVLTGRTAYGYLAMVLTGLGNASLVNINAMYRELFMGLTMIAAAIALYYAFKTHKPYVFGLLGVSLSVMVLTNAIFQYFYPFLIVLMVYLLRKQVFEKRAFWICLAALLAGYFVPTGAWMIRNYTHFGRFYITNRAGNVLSIRAEYNKMTADEFCGAFLFWTPDALFQKKAAEVMQQGRWINLHRSNPNGYYEIGKSLRTFIKPGEQFESLTERDKIIEKRALYEIVRHPFRHLAVTIPIAWRGMFVEYGCLSSVPFGILVRSTVAVSILYFASLFFWFVYSFRKQQWGLFSVTLMCMYLFGMNSFFSHGLPRYNQPLLPILAMLFVMSLWHFFNRGTVVKAKPEVRKR